MINKNIDKNKSLGYYSVDNQVYFSKIDACRAGTVKNIHPAWHFNDESFGSIDWQNNPPGSLYDWYKARAQQIREKYDYVAIYFSGGSDSQTAVNAFLDNGLFIDEIITTVNLEVSENNVYKQDIYDPKNIDLEFVYTAKPAFEKIKQRSPLTKITVKDVTKNSLDFYQQNSSDSFTEEVTEWLHPQAAVRWNPTLWKDHKLLLDRGKKVALVFCLDKPRIFYNEGKYYGYFIDTICNAYKGSLNIDYDNVDRLFFYWTPDMPELTIKQSHAIVDWFKQNPNKTYVIDGHKNIVKYAMDMDAVYKNLIYPEYMYVNPFQVRKARDTIINAHYYNFDQEFKKTKEYDKWRENVLSLHLKIDKKYLTYENGEWRGFVGFPSPFYLIADTNV